MNPVQTAADPSSYLTPNERLILPPRRHHPIIAVIPLIQATAISVFTAFVVGSFGWLGIPIVVVALIAVARANGVGRRMPFGLTVLAALVVLWVTGLLASDDRFGAAVLIGAVAYAVYGYVDHLLTWIFLTDKRIFRVDGILTRRVSTLPLRALTDIRYDRPLLGRYIGYGHFFVESAGQQQALSSLRFVSNPNEFYGVVMKEALGRQILSGDGRPTGM